MDKITDEDTEVRLAQIFLAITEGHGDFRVRVSRDGDNCELYFRPNRESLPDVPIGEYEQIFSAIQQAVDVNSQLQSLWLKSILASMDDAVKILTVLLAGVNARY